MEPKVMDYMNSKDILWTFCKGGPSTNRMAAVYCIKLWEVGWWLVKLY